ncbi:MAG: penicillin-insensitive murein endopeptidase [Alphaproteobacteria bacterium]|nr:penicillin-insensitive murein endopeptidase [Alphaproteobacteria bacterium]
MARFSIPNLLIRCLIATAIAGGAAHAQTVGSLDPKPLPPLAIKADDPKAPANQLFGRKTAPAPLEARVIGYYTSGCLAGAKAMPINGKTWQVMRLSRNRNWGHPELIAMLERLADKAPSVGWNGLLIGDLAQPRGGPMLTGHWSHQVGLDADIWLTPMPNRELSRKEREEMFATNVVAEDWMDVNPKIWSPAHIAILKAAATDKDVERVLINPAIKKALCRDVKGDRSWLKKMRPVFGHNYHFHVRIGCPKGDTACKPQPAGPAEEGCGKDLDWWFGKEARSIKPGKREPLKMSALPAACKQVLLAE